MSTVQVCVGRRTGGITIPISDGVIRGVLSKRIGMLAETINVWILWKSGAKFQILRLENKIRARGIEKNFAGVPPLNLERKWLLFVGKFEQGLSRLSMPGLWTWENRFGNLIGNFVRIINLDM